MSGNVELGCGLISIGREWGTTTHLPSNAAAQDFLEFAYTNGVHFFDTAPSYGLSEERLGRFVRGMSATERPVVATKFGEYRDESGKGYVDYSYDTIRRSIDHSLELLGYISLLQVHKTTKELLASQLLDKALEYARRQGIDRFGASTTDPEVAHAVLGDERFSYVQFPYNLASKKFQGCLERAKASNTQVIVNRPFRMGQDARHPQAVFDFILAEDFDGVVLTGTSRSEHLHENLQAFQKSKQAS